MQKITTDPQQIQKWADQYKARPELIRVDSGQDITGLRLDFPGKEDDNYLPENKKLKTVTWQQFFVEFNKLQLAFEYEDDTDLTDPSLGYRFIKRSVVEEDNKNSYDSSPI